jgi:hypothetical protein
VAQHNASLTYRLHRAKLRSARQREGRYLLRTNLTETDPAKLWSFYLQLVAVEEAFKNLKGDLWRSGRSSISIKTASRHIFLYPFLPIACM